MKKKITNHTNFSAKWFHQGVICWLLALIILAAACIGIGWKFHDYDQVRDQANIVSIRELIVQALRGVKKDAPVDPKTGDVYFPESRLFLPNPRQALTLTYLQDSGNIADSEGELSVSTWPLRSSEKLYEARNIKELFANVPHVQACSRGIKIVSKMYGADDTANELRQTVRLKNGQTRYVYVEKACPELNDTADLFKNLQTY